MSLWRIQFVLASLLISVAFAQYVEDYDGDMYDDGFNPMADQVLAGNYGFNGINSIPDLRSSRNGASPDVKAQGETTTDTSGRRKSLKEIIKAYQENYKKVMDKAIANTNASDVKEFTEKVTSCADTLKKCQKLPVQGKKCYVDCLTDGHNVLEPLTNVIADTIDFLCYPIHTLYLKIFENKGNGYPQLKTYSRFLETLGITYDEFEVAVPQFANALNVAIIQHLVTPLMPLRSTIAELERELRIQNPNGQYLTQNNPGCITLESYDAVEKLVGTFYKDAATIDILVPGYALINQASKYIVSKLSRKLAVLTETLRMFSGTATGMGCNANAFNKQDEFSKNGNCDELGRSPLSGFPIPPPVGLPDEVVSLLNPACEKAEEEGSKDGGKPSGDDAGGGDETTTETSGGDEDETTTETSGGEGDETTTETSGGEGDETTTETSGGEGDETTTETSGGDGDETTTETSDGGGDETTTETSGGDEDETTTETSGGEGDETTTETSGGDGDETTTETSGGDGDETTTETSGGDGD